MSIAANMLESREPAAKTLSVSQSLDLSAESIVNAENDPSLLPRCKANGLEIILNRIDAPEQTARINKRHYDLDGVGTRT